MLGPHITAASPDTRSIIARSACASARLVSSAMASRKSSTPAAVACVLFSALTARSPRRPAEAVDDPVGVAADRRIEDQLAVVVGRIPEDVGFAVEDETGALEIGADRRRIDP